MAPYAGRKPGDRGRLGGRNERIGGNGMDRQDTPFQLSLELPYGTKKVSSSPPVVVDSHVDSGPDLDRNVNITQGSP